ncbi:MAG: TatD family hydrolase [Candidatus Paceibacterota bacterium]|jgi:TatD DNase family protein
MNLSFIDIHSHIQFPDYDSDREAVIKRALDAGVATITVGVDLESSKKAVELANTCENVWASVGIHPTEMGNLENFDELEKLAKEPKVLAIGECGLDYFVNADKRGLKTRMDADKKRQEEVFRKQIDLAILVDKPLMLHLRSGEGNDAYEEAIKILTTYGFDKLTTGNQQLTTKLKGNAHFFAGTVEQAKKFIDMGFMLSFTGVITFTHDYDEVMKSVPLDRIMSETDCPDVSPVPFRGKRNEPINVREVVKKIAEIRGEEYEKVREQMVENAIKLFKF